MTEIKTKQDAYDFVISHWVFDKNKYPHLSLEKNFAMSQNFTLKHALLHMLMDSDIVLHMELINRNKTFSVFYEGHISNNPNLDKRYKEAVLKMLSCFLRVEGVLSIGILPSFRDMFSKKPEYSFYDCCSYFMRTVAKICERVDHENNLDEKQIVDALQIIYWNIDRLFKEQNVNVPWGLVPTVVAH